MEDLELKVLGLLLFPEAYDNLKEESASFVGLNVLSDILKGLLHKGYVQALLPDESGALRRSMGFDSDMLGDYHYQITAKGLKEIS